AVNLLPGWLLGLVTAGAALSGLLVLAGICLSIGPLVTRNLVPNIPESKQKTSTIFVIVTYLATSIVLTLFTPNLMLTIINTAYYGITQFFPGMMIILFFKGVKANAVALGIIVGQVLAILMYVNKIDLGGFNIGLICLLVNIIVLCTAHFLMKLCSKSMQTVLP
ncbi:sodium:solute symporter family protein, partial [Glaciimonas sp. Gout2]|nr:sodium:solute symporter family protein [Glaciimonas sp. Gout2]